MNKRDLESISNELQTSLVGLFEVTNQSFQEWEKGAYVCLYGKPSKRVRAILDVEREILFIGNTYDDQQQRTVSFAQKVISDSKGRLEPKLFFVIHHDPKGNSKLRKWGREAGLTIIPIYIGSGPIPKGRDLERVLSFDFFSQDPFDITGPVVSDAQFFGQRTEALELARRLQTGQIRSIFGSRKIGKTSILHRIVEEVQQNYGALMLFIDCSLDEVFNLHSGDLLAAIGGTIDDAQANGLHAAKLKPSGSAKSAIDTAARSLLIAIEKLDKPLIISFDEVDYITPGSPTVSHWKHEFVEFWRNLRGVYQAALLAKKTVSILVSGVSSKWFAAESIEGVENAALPRMRGAGMFRDVEIQSTSKSMGSPYRPAAGCCDAGRRSSRSSKSVGCAAPAEAGGLGCRKPPVLEPVGVHFANLSRRRSSELQRA